MDTFRTEAELAFAKGILQEIMMKPELGLFDELYVKYERIMCALITAQHRLKSASEDGSYYYIFATQFVDVDPKDIQEITNEEESEQCLEYISRTMSVLPNEDDKSHICLLGVCKNRQDAVSLYGRFMTKYYSKVKPPIRELHEWNDPILEVKRVDEIVIKSMILNARSGIEEL